MARDFHPNRYDPRGLQKNQRALEILLGRLFALDGEELFVLLAGKVGGQTILQGLTVEDGLVVNDLGDDHDTRFEGANEPNLLFLDASTDRVGIGTATPTSLLHARVGSGAVALTVETAAASTTDLLLVNSASSWFIRNGADGTLRIFRPGTGGVGVFYLASAAPNNSIRAEAGGVAFFAAGSFGGGVGVVFLANRTTAPGSNPAGGVIPYAQAVATNKSNLFVKNEDGQTTRLTGVDARNAGNFNSTVTTFTNVPGLDFHVEAGKTYAFLARLYFDASAVGGHKYRIGATATATSLIYHVRSISDATNALVITSRHTVLNGAGVGQAGATAGYTEISGTITVNAAGQIYVEFAQNTASGTSTILQGSVFHLREIT